MSTSLYWTEIPVEPKRHYIDMKHLFAQKFWDSDGSCGEGEIKVGRELIPYLQGIIDGNGNGDYARSAKELIAAIEANGEILIGIH